MAAVAAAGTAVATDLGVAAELAEVGGQAPAGREMAVRVEVGAQDQALAGQRRAAPEKERDSPGRRALVAAARGLVDRVEVGVRDQRQGQAQAVRQKDRHPVAATSPAARE